MRARVKSRAKPSRFDEDTIIDTITLTGVEAVGFHGVFPEERAQGQRFVVDVSLCVERLASDDDLSSTINYAAIADMIVHVVQGGPYQLIETLAHELSVQILEFAEGAESVTVTVHKPEAPIPHPFADVAVTITRSRT